MTTEPDLATAIAIVLLGVAALGWCLHWLWQRVAGAPRTEADRIDDLIRRLHDGEAARAAAEAARDAAERKLETREIELRQEIREVRGNLEARLADREAELADAVRAAETEARTAWEGLAAARARIGELERAIAEDRRER